MLTSLWWEPSFKQSKGFVVPPLDKWCAAYRSKLRLGQGREFQGLSSRRRHARLIRHVVWAWVGFSGGKHKYIARWIALFTRMFIRGVKRSWTRLRFEGKRLYKWNLTQFMKACTLPALKPARNCFSKTNSTCVFSVQVSFVISWEEIGKCYVLLTEIWETFSKLST